MMSCDSMSQICGLALQMLATPGSLYLINTAGGQMIDLSASGESALLAEAA